MLRFSQKVYMETTLCWPRLRWEGDIEVREAECEHTDRTGLFHDEVRMSTALNLGFLNFVVFISKGNTIYVNTTILTFDMFAFHYVFRPCLMRHLQVAKYLKKPAYLNGMPTFYRNWALFYIFTFRCVVNFVIIC
jgi:hypothetical protein